MNIQDQLQHELHRLKSVKRSEAQPQVVAVDTDLGHFKFVLVAIDSMSCAVTNLSLSTTRFQAASVDQLGILGSELASRLIYLLEPISPIEIDKDGGTMQLRSNPPRQDDDGTQYFELLVHHSGIQLCRYQKAPGHVRRVISAQLTHEVLGRLASDFAAAVANF